MLRPRQATDRAFAHVLAIISAWIGDHCTPFFLVKFFKKVFPRPKLHNSAYVLETVKLQENIYIGEYGYGAALYPISSLTTPAFALTQKQQFLIFPLRFFSRSRWVEETIGDNPVRRNVTNLQQYELRVEDSDIEHWSDISSEEDHIS